ncbi:hypothetical protein [Flavobacterium subsaxonicum]|nr:hypothetical protein [Flavobacterium subsaxonicum]
MKLKIIFITATCLMSLVAMSQNHLLVYHGSGGTTQVFDAQNHSVVNPSVRLEEGQTFTITVLNPNPALYSYKLKTADIEVKAEEKEITDLLSTFSTILGSRVGNSAVAAFLALTPLQKYHVIIKELSDAVDLAKKHIKDSDVAESIIQAQAYDSNVGFRKAVRDIGTMPNGQYKFNNPNLLNDLNALSDLSGVGTLEKEAFRLLNNSLVEKINEIKKQANPATTLTVWTETFKVTEKTTQISIEIEKIDKNNTSLVRDGNGAAPYILNVALIEPYFKRATLELVPVASITHSNYYNEFYLENNVVRSRERSKTMFNTGIILNVNIARFGVAKEMAVGIGPGYKFSAEENDFENLYLSALFSYKNFLRVGVGFGFSKVPRDDLKGGVKTGDLLPANISNLDDLIQYEEKPGFFFTISFAGLNLTKKK